jgi:hypothetical protein
VLLRTLASLSGQWRNQLTGDLAVRMVDVRPLAQPKKEMSHSTW